MNFLSVSQTENPPLDMVQEEEYGTQGYKITTCKLFNGKLEIWEATCTL